MPRVPLGLFAAPLFVASSLIVAAQTPSITTTTDLVVVPALVREASGNLVQSLRASDFLLTDNGVPQTITIEDAERQPLSIVVIMQTGESAPSEFPNFEKLGPMLTYLTANRPHQIAMVTFDSRPEEQWDFTPEYCQSRGRVHPTLLLEMTKLPFSMRSHMGLIFCGKRPPNRRRLIILLSQSHDDGSLTQAEEIIKRLGVKATSPSSVLTFSPEKDLAQTSVHQGRAIMRTSPTNMVLNGPKLLHTFNLDKPLRVALNSLREDTSSSIALMSGGESLPFASKAELEQELATLANHLAATFTRSASSPIRKQVWLPFSPASCC